MSLLGIDVGTTGCKAIAFNLDGEIIAQAYGEYPLIHPKPGWSELDSNLVWERVSDAIRKVASETRNDPIEALAVASQGEAVTPISKEGGILDTAITTFDSRADEIAEEVGQEMTKLQIMRITGMPLSGITTLAKLIWLRRNKPDIYERTWKFLGYEDFVLFKLGVPPVEDWSLASRTMLFDIIGKRWSGRMLELAGVDRTLLPDTAPSGTPVGEVSPKVAQELGLPRGVVGVTGGHDQPCGALGAGVIRGGLVMDATGTVECFAPAFTEPVLNERMIEGNFACYPHVVPDLYVTLAFVSSGGVVLRWFRDTFAEREIEEAKKRGVNVYDLLMEEMSDEISPVMLLPHFSGSGTPYLDTQSKGAVLGLSLATGKGDIIRAILEGVSFEMKYNLELLQEAGVKIDEIRAIGGGAKSERWLQLKADMYDKPVVAMDVSEGVCLGAAILAGVAIGRYRSVREAVEHLVRPRKVYLPRQRFRERYEERFEIYKRIYPAIREISHML
jgi:xylulokinase